MIGFERNGTKAELIVEVFVPTVGVRLFRFSYECGSEVYAGILTDLFTDQFTQKVQKTRKKEYLEGLKAGRARGKKREYFYLSLEP